MLQITKTPDLINTSNIKYSGLLFDRGLIKYLLNSVPYGFIFGTMLHKSNLSCEPCYKI